MILVPGAFLRVGLLALLAVIIQVSGFGQIQVLGSAPNLVPLVVAAVALYGGSIPGAATGFGTGVLLDLAAGQTLGVSSLVLTTVGYGVGRFREIREPAHGLMPIPVGAAATFAWAAAFAAVSFMLDTEAIVSPLVLRDMVVTTLLGALLALPVFALCRRVIRPVLLRDPVEARRRRREPPDAGPIGLRGMEVSR